MLKQKQAEAALKVIHKFFKWVFNKIPTISPEKHCETHSFDLARAALAHIRVG